MKQVSAQEVSKGCEAAQQDIALAVYGELADDASHRLEHHLSACEHCRQEMKAVKGLRQAMSLYPMEEPSPNLLARTRLRLEDALDALPGSGWFTRIVDRLFIGIARVQSAPVMASVFLCLGLSAGGLAGYGAGHHSPQIETAHSTTVQASSEKIASVQSIEGEPGSEEVKITFNRLVPESMRGSLDSPEVRSLLVMAASNRVDENEIRAKNRLGNSDVREKSIGLLASECRAGHQCQDGPVREALMVALRRDRNAGVRLKALEGLQPYVDQDRRVRDVVLNALLRDSDANVRLKAVDLLQSVDGDSSVRQVLGVTATDQNPYLRDASRHVLSGLPEIQ